MDIKANVIVLFARPYDMVDDKTNQRSSGVTIQYLMTDNLLPVNGEQDKGIKANRCSLTIDKATKFNHVPGIYQAEFSMKTNANGKPELAVSDVTFKGFIETKLVNESKDLK